MHHGLFRRSTAFVVAGLIGLALSLSCGDIDEDELVCEEAVARLETCCPRIDPRRLNCVYQQGCNGNNLFPVLNARATECLKDASCTDLVARGICDGIRQQSFIPYPFQSREDLEAEACR